MSIGPPLIHRAVCVRDPTLCLSTRRQIPPKKYNMHSGNNIYVYFACIDINGGRTFFLR